MAYKINLQHTASTQTGKIMVVKRRTNLGARLEAAVKANPSIVNDSSTEGQDHMAINLRTNLSKALDAALKAAAPDGGSYLAGEVAFWRTLREEGKSIGEAIDAALKAAAPDGGSYLAGEAEFNRGLDGTWKQRLVDVKDDVVGSAKGKRDRQADAKGKKHRLH